MSIFTQVFLVNLILWLSLAAMFGLAGVDTDKLIDEGGTKGTFVLLWTLLTMASVPAILIYLVIA